VTGTTIGRFARADSSEPAQGRSPLPSDTGSEGTSTAGCPAVARLVIPSVIAPTVTPQVRTALTKAKVSKWTDQAMM
jgi:hypothetical protein